MVINMKRVQDKTVRNARMKQFKGRKNLKSIGQTTFLILSLSVIGIGFFFGIWVMGVLGDARELDVRRIVSTNTTQILDRNGTIVRETGITREWVSLNEISPVMIDAILAIEDARFYEHYGVDWTRTLAAQLSNVETLVTGTGGIQGGSTITQQLINQTHLLDEDGNRDTSIDRKLEEMLLSFQIERILSKDQILEAYLNYSPFGGGIYGVQAASEFYFGVDASRLTLSQAATLAGLVQAPNDFRPDRHPHITEVRRNEVLYMMERHGYITSTIRDLAAGEPITDVLVYYRSVSAEENAIFNDYVNHVLNEAYERWGINAHEGYTIETYLDPDIQTELITALTTNERVGWPDDYIQSAISVIDTQSGHIVGLAGRDLQRTEYDRNRERASVLPTHIKRSIGSTAKPIWAYGPAMEYLNWSPGTMLNDDLFAYASGMLVRNWSLQHEGRVSMRQAIAPSWNPPALQAFNAVVNEDPNLVANFVTGLGIPEDQVGWYVDAGGNQSDSLLESYAIGGNRTGMSPMHLAGAYAAFGNTGVYNEPRAIRRIIAPDGTIYYEPPGEVQPFRTERVMSEQTAYMMTDVLRTSVTNDQSRGDLHWATGTQANIPGWFIAAKTGTTNFDADTMARHNIPAGGVPDVWIAGYTHEYTMSIWVGYDSLAEGRYVYGNSRDIPNHLFREVMSRINHENPARSPQRPQGIIEANFELMAGTEIGVTCLPTGTSGALVRTELFLEGYGPRTCEATHYAIQLEAPTNFSVSASGTTLNFSWNAGNVSMGAMTLEEAQAAAARANALALQSTHMTDALRNLRPTEGEARMMIKRIQAGVGVGGGDIEYVVIANLIGGGTRELVTTTDTSVSYPVSPSDIADIRTFHVIARRGNTTSSPSNLANNDVNLIEPSDLEIVIPDMEGWTLSRFEEWANANNVQYSPPTEAYSNRVAEGLIITTNPTGTMRIDQTIRITISLGPQQDEGGATDSPQDPTPDSDQNVDELNDWCEDNEDDPLCDIL